MKRNYPYPDFGSDFRHELMDVNLSDFDGLQRKLKSTGKIWVLIKIHNFDRITVEIESTPPTNKDQFYSDLADAILDAFEANEFYP